MNTTWYRHGICTPTSCDLGSRTRPSSKFLRVRGGSRGGTLNGGRLPETSNCFCHPGKAGGLPLCAKAVLAAGHRVRAFARSATSMGLSEPNLECFTGDAVDAGDVARALDGIDVVVQALGVPGRDLLGPVRLFSDATNVLVPTMEKVGVHRLIPVTGFGAGDSRDAIGFLQRLPFRLVLGRAYDDKDAQEMR